MNELASAGFTWLRPVWLWALVPWLLAGGLYWRYGRTPSDWERIVDPALQPYVIDAGRSAAGRGPVVLWLGWLAAILALAGPVWEQQDVPVFETHSAQVIVFDLSLSMLVEDVSPNRLTRARYKLRDLLARSGDTQMALIVFSERPYVISPLTDDASTVRAFVPSLSPGIMPVSGSRLDLAIDKGTELLDQAGIAHGQLVVISDAEAGDADVAAAARARRAGHRVSVLAVGTPEGAPLQNEEGRYYVDADGQQIIPGLQLAALRAVSEAGDGFFGRLAADDRDLEAVTRVQSSLAPSGQTPQSGRQERYWIERGPWLVILLAGAGLLLFRRGLVW